MSSGMHGLKKSKKDKTPERNSCRAEDEKMVRKKDIVKEIAETFHIPTKLSKMIVNFFLNRIIEALDEGEKVTLAGFGTFSIEERKGRMGRNPQTGEKLYIESKRVIHFSVCNSLKNRIW